MKSGGDKQISECIGHPVEIYDNIFQKEDGAVKGGVPLCLLRAYQENLLVKRKPWGESEHVSLEIIILTGNSQMTLSIRQNNFKKFK